MSQPVLLTLLKTVSPTFRHRLASVLARTSDYESMRVKGVEVIINEEDESGEETHVRFYAERRGVTATFTSIIHKDGWTEETITFGAQAAEPIHQVLARTGTRVAVPLQQALPDAYRIMGLPKLIQPLMDMDVVQSESWKDGAAHFVDLTFAPVA